MRKEKENPGYDSRDRNEEMYRSDDAKAEHSREKSSSEDAFSDFDLSEDLEGEVM